MYSSLPFIYILFFLPMKKKTVLSLKVNIYAVSLFILGLLLRSEKHNGIVESEKRYG